MALAMISARGCAVWSKTYMAIYSCMRMCGESLTRMASKNHDQYLFCELRFWGDAFAPLGEC
jgi:hypothetical protein